MKVIEPGHVYALDTFDGGRPQHLTFVAREPENSREHPGTQTQEVLRAMIDMTECLIDRTNHCDARCPWEGNPRIIKALSEAQRQMRLAIMGHEQHALSRKLDKGLLIERVATAADGHFEHPVES